MHLFIFYNQNLTFIINHKYGCVIHISIDAVGSWVHRCMTKILCAPILKPLAACLHYKYKRDQFFREVP